MATINITKMLEDICAHYKCKVNLPADKNIKVRGVDIRLGQVFDNLLSNAKSFSDTIELIVERQGKLWHITVEDEGPGIPESKLETIFERFYTERPQSESFGNHSGLGLAICKQIIDAHDGRIYAENRHNDKGQVNGARFTVILKAI